MFVKHIIDTKLKPFVNINFEWPDSHNVPTPQCEIRILFVPRWGAWSAVGNDSDDDRYKNDPSMNLGWLDDENSEGKFKNSGAVIIHEFCHALGMIHEHLRSDSKLKFDVEAVNSFMSCCPNCWDQDTIDFNILNTIEKNDDDKKDEEGKFRGTEYDNNGVRKYLQKKGIKHMGKDLLVHGEYGGQ